MANNKTLELSIKIAGKMDKKPDGGAEREPEPDQQLCPQHQLHRNGGTCGHGDAGNGDCGNHRKLHQGSGEV